MNKKYVDLLKAIARATAVTSEQVMDHDHEQNDSKIRRKEDLDKYDRKMVESLPIMCAKKDRTYYRVESLKIINKYFY